MSDAEQIVLLQGIMELRESLGDVFLDPTTMIVITVALIAVVNLLVWVWRRRDPQVRNYVMLLISVGSVSIGMIIVDYAMITQHDMEEYRMLCETYRTLYGPLPWEVA